MKARASQPRKGLRGQPVIMLGVLLAGWGALRFATWVSPVPEDYFAAMAAADAGAGEQTRVQDDRRMQLRAPVLAPAPKGNSIAPPIVPLEGGWNDPRYLGGPQSSLYGPSGANEDDRLTQVPQAGTEGDAAGPARLRMAAGHTLLAAAGFSRMELPPEIAAFYQRQLGPAASTGSEGNPLLAAARLPDAVPRAVPPLAERDSGASRWSADGWLLWRDDTTTPITSGRPSYGRSQMGAVVRYELAPKSAIRPQAYLRGSASLEGANEQEVAAGLSARPFARLPIRMAAELRVSERAEASEVRPAVFAVTELAPQQLPGGLQAEAYGQAGYVGGTYSTAFVDGQLRVDGSLASDGDFDLRAGGGVWGGAQEDGERLDIGPSASLTFRVGEARGRVAADYRFRVAGDAQPASGPALTLSAGF